MKSFLLFFILSFLLSFTLFAQDGERDGSSYEKAIVILETTETVGVHAEYKWLSENYPRYKMKKQALSYYNGKPYDILFIKQKGKKKKIYFDISAFFGKF